MHATAQGSGLGAKQSLDEFEGQHGALQFNFSAQQLLNLSAVTPQRLQHFLGFPVAFHQIVGGLFDEFHGAGKGQVVTVFAGGHAHEFLNLGDKFIAGLT